MSAPTAKHLRWPADRFYWTVIDGTAWRRTGPVPEAFMDEVLPDLPAGPVALHAVGAPSSDGRLIVCAVPEDLLRAVPPDAASVAPESLPIELEASCDPALLNHLVGAFEPRGARRARTGKHLAAMSVALALAGLLALGFVRRAERWATDAKVVSAASTAAIASSGLVNEQAIDRELERLRRSDRAAVGARRPADAAAELATLLLAWPATVASRPHSITVGDSGASVSVSVEGDPTEFLRAFRAPAGWSLDQPRLNSSGDLTRISLQFRPARGGTP